MLYTLATHTSQPATRDRLTIVSLWVFAAVVFIGLLAGGYPATGVVTFLGIGVVSVVYWRLFGPMFDERDADIVTTASTQLVQLLGITAGIVFPTLTLLQAFGYIEWPVWLTPITMLVAALFVVWVGLLGLARHRR